MSLKRSVQLLAILAIFTFLSCTDPAPSGETNDANSPNIVLIIADDMGWDVFGDYPGADGIKANTPTLDSLALNGISFLNFWTNPICAPTRASILTGKYAFRSGVGGVQTPQQATLQPDETILQKYISDKTGNKYASAVIGKWHVNSEAQLTAPEDFGVDYYSGIFLGAVPDYYNWTQTSSGTQQKITTYTTTHLVNQSISWVGEQSKPFFLWLAFNAPHTPFHRPPLELITDQSLVENPAAIAANPLPYYLSAIEAMDREIARFIASMTAAQRENTVFIFMGDNGTPREVSQNPYLSTKVKGTLYQGGINCPLLISGKNVSRKNVIETALVQSPDLFATIANLAGTNDKAYQDGSSLLPLLTDTNGTKRTFTYSEQFDNTNTNNDGYTLQTEKYKLIHLENGTEFYFQLNTDPFEANNLLSKPLSVEAQQTLDKIRQIKENL